MKFIKYISCFFIYFYCININVSLLATEEKEECDVTITFHNVGQGNCIDVEFIKNNKKEYMIMDIGSSYYNEEWKYTELAKKLKENTYFGHGIFVPKTPAKLTHKPTISVESPTSEETASCFPDEESLSMLKEKDFPTKENFLSKLRDKFCKYCRENDMIDDHRNHHNFGIRVETVIISHPNKDHYGWLKNLFNNNIDDKIKYLILAGLPQQYKKSENSEFLSWIQECIESKTISKVYFPAISEQPIISVKDLISNKESIFSRHSYSHEEEDKFPFKDALTFFKNKGTVELSLLSVNPTHFKGLNNVIRMSFPEDDNSDSLVLKISNGNSSAILTGDATCLTTTRIIDNYAKNPGFLKTNVLLASHHGSRMSGSNNQEWINITKPEYVLISNGYTEGHPHLETYERFKKSSSLKKDVKKHNILVQSLDKDKKYKQRKDDLFYKTHKTTKAIFSTLDSGTLTLKLSKEKVILSTEVDGDINHHNSSTEINDNDKKGDKKGKKLVIVTKNTTSKTNGLPFTKDDPVMKKMNSIQIFKKSTKSKSPRETHESSLEGPNKKITKNRQKKEKDSHTKK